MTTAGSSSTQNVLGLALRRYVDARSAALIEARRALGVNELDARAILYIAVNPGTRPTNLRNYLGITSAGVTALIDRLVDRGAVRRDVDDADRRVNRITLIVDLDENPWNALGAFDRAFDQAVVDGGSDLSDFASCLDELTATASVR